MIAEIWIKLDGENTEASAEPFHGACRYVKQGQPFSRAKEDLKLVGAFERGSQAEYLSDNPFSVDSERGQAWRAGFEWAQ